MWRFRPSAFLLPSRYVDASASTLYEHYMADNEKATKDGVKVPPRPSLFDDDGDEEAEAEHCALHAVTTTTTSGRSNITMLRRLRNCQWNVHYFEPTKQVSDSCQLAMMIADKVLEMEADVIVLNEFGTMAPRFATTTTGATFGDEDDHDDHDDHDDGRSKLPVEYCRDRLKLHGYSLYTANCFFPTVVATKLPVRLTKKFSLDENRAAVAVQIELWDNDDIHTDSSIRASSTDPTTLAEGSIPVSTPSNNNDGTLWIYGTHFEAGDDCNGSYRRLEVDRLLEVMQQHHPNATFGLDDDVCSAEDKTATEAVGEISSDTSTSNKNNDPFMMLVGDFNQQRAQDYTVEEWKAISENKARRESPLDDGVATALKEAGFHCIFDGNGKNAAGVPSTATVRRNWPGHTPPPSSHWSGTLIDFTYFRGSGVQLTGVYVSPCNLSDHRMIVCDWIVEQ